MSVITKPRPTYEQATAIDNARLGKSFKVIAYAGTGKTTTLQMISDAMPEPLPQKHKVNFIVRSIVVHFTRLHIAAFHVESPTNYAYPV